MAPGPNLCRFERTSAARQTWRVGARSPGEIRGFRVSGPGRSGSLSGRRVGGVAAGAVTAATLEAAEEDRVVEVDIAERSAQELQGVAGQGVRIVRVDAELFGDAGMTLAEPERDDGGGPFGGREGC